VQYPPLSIGEDAQPPPPARMVPQLVLPRRLEFGVSGSSLPPLQHPYRIHPVTDRLPGQPLRSAAYRLCRPRPEAVATKAFGRPPMESWTLRSSTARPGGRDALSDLLYQTSMSAEEQQTEGKLRRN
jgi:hypothetical protein